MCYAEATRRPDNVRARPTRQRRALRDVNKASGICTVKLWCENCCRRRRRLSRGGNLLFSSSFSECGVCLIAGPITARGRVRQPLAAHTAKAEATQFPWRAKLVTKGFPRLHAGASSSRGATQGRDSEAVRSAPQPSRCARLTAPHYNGDDAEASKMQLRVGRCEPRLVREPRPTGAKRSATARSVSASKTCGENRINLTQHLSKERRTTYVGESCTHLEHF